MSLYPNINIIFLIWVIALAAVVNFALFSVPPSGKFSPGFINTLAYWDGGHFISIAQHGYSEKFQYAFFPLYPILINLLNKFINNYIYSAILINFSCIYLSLHLFFKLIAKDFSKKLAETAVLFLLFFPTSFFFLAAYSESLFFLLTILAFYFLRQGKLFWATVAVMLVSSTRITGLAVVFALLLEVQLRGGINKKNWFVLLSPLGFFIYCWYLFIQTSDPFYFLTAESYWQRQLSIPGVSLWEGINALLKGLVSGSNYMIILDLTATIFGLGLILRSFRFLPLSYCVFGLLSILLPLFTSSLTSMPRFVLSVFPLFITLSLIENKFIKIGYSVFGLIFLGLLTALFVSGYWVS